MSICLITTNNGVVKIETANLTLCEFYGLEPAEYEQFQAVTGGALVTPEEILYVYTWGMGAVLLPFSIALAVKWAMKTLNLL